MNCHQYSGLRQHKFILWSAGQKSEMGLQDCVPSGGSGENLFIVFSSFWRPPASLGLWPHHSDLCFHHHITLSDSDPTAYPYDYTGGLLLIQDNLPILRVLNLTSPEKSLCHSQVPEDMDIFVRGRGGYYSTYHIISPFPGGSDGKEEKAMAPHSSTLAWKIPWTEGPGRLQSMGLLGIRHD